MTSSGFKTAFVMLGLFCGAGVMLAAGCDVAPEEPSSVRPREGQVAEASEGLDTAPVCVTFQRGVNGTVNDTYINAFTPTTNFGTSTSAYSQGTPVSKALFKFSLSGIPSNATVTSATVNLKEWANGGSDTVHVRKITSSWSESTVTWNTAPTINTTRSGSFSTSGLLHASFDVTSLVQGWVTSPSTNFGFELDQANTYTQWKTSESTTVSDRPSLQVCFSVPCASGFGDCDMANGDCETNLNMSTSHCGACGAVCGTAHTTSVSCDSGTCTLHCAPGWANADNDPSNGCERDLSVPGIIDSVAASCGGPCDTSTHQLTGFSDSADVCHLADCESNPSSASNLSICAGPGTAISVYRKCSSEGCDDGDRAVAVYVPCDTGLCGTYVVCTHIQ